MVTIEYQGEKFMFAPDVQGPMSLSARNKILDEKPDILLIGGPPLYLAQFRYKETALHQGLNNLATIIKTTPYTIVEHHRLRDKEWLPTTQKCFQHNSTRRNFGTAAEYLRQPNRLLEARRKQLFIDYPPSKNFQKWMRKSITTKKQVKPPL